MDTPFNPFHWLVVLVIAGLLIPIQRILRRAGFSGWWCLLLFVPFVNFIGLWVLAFKRWPALQPVGTADSVAIEKRVEVLKRELADLLTISQKPETKTGV
jgi:hypothetical protein